MCGSNDRRVVYKRSTLVFLTKFACVRTRGWENKYTQIEICSPKEDRRETLHDVSPIIAGDLPGEHRRSVASGISIDRGYQ